MTMKERFENNAREHGCTILISEPTKLQILATNGSFVTTYEFDENGDFISYSHSEI